ncbi:hypothetical protein BTUL_0240g00150 [Botrytis tulipae]|uniref:Uncharacterized protein n=1 Tax=Botrytis tulipae TaxID=87230 RepID=A0A4Z1E780_9HELO|nr:hypothetical protein BTUL_0240g00150 [Botrytis tulipae]
MTNNCVTAGDTPADIGFSRLHAKPKRPHIPCSPKVPANHSPVFVTQPKADMRGVGGTSWSWCLELRI